MSQIFYVPEKEMWLAQKELACLSTLLFKHINFVHS